MHRKLYWMVMVTVLALLAISCSGSSSSPVLPDPVAAGTPGLTAGHIPQIQQGSQKATWGVWNIAIDTTTWEASIEPLRGAQYTVDVVNFLQPPLGSLANLKIIVTDVADWATEGLIGVDVGLTHPFPGLDQFTGFDVYGVFVGPGSVAGMYDGDVIYTGGVDEPELLNPDGYTRWQNPVEFAPDGTFFNFVPGAIGNPDLALFTATINAYKYFADGLEKDQDVSEFFVDPNSVDRRGIFRPGSTNFREYDFKFTIEGDEPLLIFQYAVIASWVEPDTALTGDPGVLDVPGDFASSANADEAFFISVTDNSTLYYVGGEAGGDVILELEVFDWGSHLSPLTVPEEIFQIVVGGHPDVIPGGYATFDQTTLAATATQGSTGISSVFQVEIANCTPQSEADVPLLITVESMAPDTFDPGIGSAPTDDRLAGYFFFDAPVGDEVPLDFAVISPNGGETLWMSLYHEITWNPTFPGVTDVKIEWSTDNFGSDIQTIIDSTENDGSYMWLPIPNVETDTALIRITDVLGAVSDTSDDVFSIALPVWLVFQDEVDVDNTSVAWSYVAYLKTWDEFSPALSQDLDGLVHVCWHGEIPYQARDMGIRSSNGNTWTGEGGFLFTSGGPGYGLRGDYMKLAAAANNTTFAAVWHWTIFFSLDVDHFPNGHNNYNWPCLVNRIYSNSEIMADANYLYMVSDGHTSAGGNGPGIYSVRVPTPNWSWTCGPMNAITASGEISHARSWTFHDDTLVLAYFTNGGQIKLLKQTDQAADSWDDTEVIFDGSGYDSCKHPSICEDGNGRLIAVWLGRETSSGEYHILASMKEDSTSSWTEPMIAAFASSEFHDLHVSTPADLVDLPTGDQEYPVLIGYELGSEVLSAISPKDLWAFLPPQQVSAEGESAKQPDVLCLESPYVYDALFTWSFEVTTSNWDIKFRNADFETP